MKKYSVCLVFVKNNTQYLRNYCTEAIDEDQAFGIAFRIISKKLSSSYLENWCVQEITI
jgi:hypothetical protein